MPVAASDANETRRLVTGSEARVEAATVIDVVAVQTGRAAVSAAVTTAAVGETGRVSRL